MKAKIVLDFIRDKFANDPDPLINSDILAECVKRGYLDATHTKRK